MITDQVLKNSVVEFAEPYHNFKVNKNTFKNGQEYSTASRARERVSERASERTSDIWLFSTTVQCLHPLDFGQGAIGYLEANKVYKNAKAGVEIKDGAKPEFVNCQIYECKAAGGNRISGGGMVVN